MKATLIITGVAFLLSGCCWKRHEVTRPVVIETERLVVQPIPEELLNEHPIASGPLSECPSVAARRKAELMNCNADKAAIRSLTEDMNAK